MKNTSSQDTQGSLSIIDQKIIRLKQQKQKLQTQQAIIFLKEAQKIIGEENFTIEFALSVLSQSWNNASDKQKEEWHKAASSFREFTRRRQRQGDQRDTQKSPKTDLKSAAANP